jgi:hypothetical protein
MVQAMAALAPAPAAAAAGPLAGSAGLASALPLFSPTGLSAGVH